VARAAVAQASARVLGRLREQRDRTHSHAAWALGDSFASSTTYTKIFLLGTHGATRKNCIGASRALGVIELRAYDFAAAAPSLSPSGETLTIEESMTLRARTENAGHVGVEHEWSQGR
jgi:hypothetical protein